jgi:NAD+ kinase
MAITFIAPHSLRVRPLVVGRSAEVVISNRTADVGATVLVDGHEKNELAAGESVHVRLGEQRSLLATLPESMFFRRYREIFAS